MLSFLYRLIRAFRAEHGYSPNAVAMNRRHYQQLLHSVPEIRGYGSVAEFLRMQVILSEDCVHPHVAWLAQVERVSHAG